MCICIYVYIYSTARILPPAPEFESVLESTCLHSAKEGAVETGCSGLYDVIYQFTI